MNQLAEDDAIAAERKRPGPICPWCQHKLFLPRLNKRYCSNACKQAAYRCRLKVNAQLVGHPLKDVTDWGPVIRNAIKRCQAERTDTTELEKLLAELEAAGRVRKDGDA